MEVQPLVSPRPGDLKLCVRVVGPQFNAESDQVWVEDDAFQRFLQELRSLAARRPGWARLHSVSLDGLSLHVRPVGRSGAVSLTVSFSVTDLDRSSFGVQFVLELLRDGLRQAIAGFERLRSEGAEQSASADSPRE